MKVRIIGECLLSDVADKSDERIAHCGSRSLGSLVDSILGTYLRKQDESRSRLFMESLLQSGRKKVVIVTGEFDPSFYTHDIGTAVARSLQKGAEVHALLTEAVPNDKEQSIKKLVENNYQFLKTLHKQACVEELDDLVLKNLHFHFSTHRQEEHFAVVDRDVFLESYHRTGEPRAVYFKRSTDWLADKYNSKWERVVNGPGVYEISTKDLLLAFVEERNKRRKASHESGIFQS